ncbi:hypothetical protein JCM10914A_55900 [Paenibacillus sp. JCM 10914]
MSLLTLIIAGLGSAVGHLTVDVDRQGCCAGNAGKITALYYGLHGNRQVRILSRSMLTGAAPDTYI